MTINGISSLYFLPAILFMFIAGYIMPFLTKRTILFGSRIPVELNKRAEIISLKQQFRYMYLELMLPVSFLMGFIIYSTSLPTVQVLCMFLEWVLILILYISFNKKTKMLKKAYIKLDGAKQVKNIKVIDTKFREEKFMFPAYWFLPSLLLIILNTSLLYIKFGDIPARIPFHFDIRGDANMYAGKTILHVFYLPIISLFILLLFIGIFYSIKYSKQELDSEDPEASASRGRKFRFVWSVYLILLNFILTAWMFFSSLYSCGIIRVSPAVFNISNLSLILSILLSSLILAVMTGQSGSRLNVKKGETGINTSSVDDDSYWKLGIFYYNPDDPSLFVEKRIGVGWTINFGRPIAIILLLAVILLPLILKLFLR